MQLIKKLNIILFGIFLCLGSQMYAMEEVKDQISKQPEKQTKFLESPKQWAIEKMRNAKNAIGKNLFENGNISKKRTVFGYNIYDNHFDNDDEYKKFRAKLLSQKPNDTEQSNAIQNTPNSILSTQIAVLQTDSLSANGSKQTSENIANAYEKLHLNPNVDPSIIDKQYKKLALQYHPDKSNGNMKAFQDLQSAYQTIKEHLESNLKTPGSVQSIQGHDAKAQITDKPESKVTKIQRSLDQSITKIDEALEIKKTLSFRSENTKRLKEIQSNMDKKEKEIEAVYRNIPDKNDVSVKNNPELQDLFKVYYSLESEEKSLLGSLKNIGTLVNPNFKTYQAPVSQDDYKTAAMTEINEASDKEKYIKEITNLAKKRNDLSDSSTTNDDNLNIGLNIGYGDLIYEGIIESIVDDPFNYQAKFNAIKKQLSPIKNSSPITEEIKNKILSDLCPSTKDLSINQKNNLFEKLNNGESVKSLLKEETTEEQKELPMNNSPFVLDQATTKIAAQHDQDMTTIKLEKDKEALNKNFLDQKLQENKTSQKNAAQEHLKKIAQIDAQIALIETESNESKERTNTKKEEALEWQKLLQNMNNILPKQKLTPEQIAENRRNAPKLNPTRAKEIQDQRLKQQQESLRQLSEQAELKKAQELQDLMGEQAKNEDLFTSQKSNRSDSETERRAHISKQETTDFEDNLKKFQERIVAQAQKENTAQESANRSKLLDQENSELQAIKALQDKIKTQHQKETVAQAEKLAQEKKAAQELKQRLIDLQQKSKSNEQALFSGETKARIDLDAEHDLGLEEIKESKQNAEAARKIGGQQGIILEHETGRTPIHLQQEAELNDLQAKMLADSAKLKQNEKQKAKDLADKKAQAEAEKNAPAIKLKTTPMMETIVKNRHLETTNDGNTELHNALKENNFDLAYKLLLATHTKQFINKQNLKQLTPLDILESKINDKKLTFAEYTKLLNAMKKLGAKSAKN